MQQTAIGGDDVGSQQIIACEPELPRQPTIAAAQRQACDPGVGVDPEGCRQTKGLRFAIELAQPQPRLRLRDAAGRIDPNSLHQRQIDHQPIGADGLAGIVVTATANGHEDIVVAGEPNAGENVGGSDAAGDQSRPSVDHPVPHAAGGLVFGMPVSEQRPTQPGGKPVNCGAIDHAVIAVGRDHPVRCHAVLPVRRR